MRKLTKQFLGVEETKGPRGGNVFERKKKRRKRGQKEDIGVADYTAAGKQQAVTAVGEHARMPVFYPTRLKRGSQFVRTPRVYKLETGAGTKFNSYRMVVASGLVGQYYGLQGTTWRNPPILRGPTERRKIRRAQVRGALRRRPGAAGGMAHQARRLLDLQHAAPDAHREADAGNRGVHADAVRAG